MQYITDLNEIFRILNECCGEPVYKSVGKDENGCEIAVPCYAVGEKEAIKPKMQKGGAA